MEEATVTQEAQAEVPRPAKRRPKVAKPKAKKKSGAQREVEADGPEFHSVRLSTECMQKINRLRGKIMQEEGTNPSTSKVIENAIDGAL